MAKKSSKLFNLYDFNENKYGKKIFKKKPSTFTVEEIKQLVKGINDRLYKIEQKNMQLDSNLYRNLMKYANKQKDDNGIFNVSEDGRIRITSNIKRISGSDNNEKYENIRNIQGYLAAKTSTVGGTNKAIKQAYQTFVERPDIKYYAKQKPTLEEYKNLWRTYREQVSQDKKDILGSDVVLDLVKSVKFYDLPQSQLEKAFKYTDQIESIEKSTGLNELYELWKKGKLVTGEV